MPQEQFCLFSMFTLSQWVLKHNDAKTMPLLLGEFQIYHLKSIWGANYICKTLSRSHFSTEILTHNLHNFTLCLLQSCIPALQQQPLKVRSYFLVTVWLIWNPPISCLSSNFPSLCRGRRKKCLQKYRDLKQRNGIIKVGVPLVSTPESWILAHRDCTA